MAMTTAVNKVAISSMDIPESKNGHTVPYPPPFA
jgi:hypothetical protein